MSQGIRKFIAENALVSLKLNHRFQRNLNFSDLDFFYVFDIATPLAVIFLMFIVLSGGKGGNVSVDKHMPFTNR